MAPTRIIFLAAILFTWGTAEALKFNSWIPNIAQDAVNPSLVMKRNAPPIVPKRPNSSWIISSKLKNDGNLQPVPKTTYDDECGSHTLYPGDTVIIQSKNYPDRAPKWENCRWNFRAPLGATISIHCPVFRLKKCRKTFLKIDDGSFLEKYCGKMDGLSVSSSTGNMVIIFKSLKTKTLGFECYVTASDVSTTTTTESTITTTTTEPSTTTTTTTTEPPTTTTTTEPPTTTTTTEPPTTTTTTEPPTTTTTTTTEPPTTTTTEPNTCKCGHVNTNTRIVGGNPTEVHQYPWQIALTDRYRNKPFCGGSIISDQWILTGAYCVDGKNPSNNRIVIGEHDWNSDSETTVTERREISQFVVHPDFNNQNMDNDIALVKLKSPIEFSTDNKIAPICLPPSGELYENVDAIVTGWGTLISGGSQPDELYEVTLPTMSNDECKSDLGSLGSYITMNMICAGLDAGGKDSCQYDSGGPLITAGDAAQNYMVQIGTVSWGLGCARAGKPGVYARVNNYLDWIASTTSGSTTCPSS